MDTRTIYDQIVRNAAILRDMHTDMHSKHKLRDQGPEAVLAWHNAAQVFREQYNALAFPGGYDGALDRLLAGEQDTMEAAICFLELRPFYYRSGYMFKDLLRKARKAPLNAAQRERLQVVEAAVLDWRARKLKRQQTRTTQAAQSNLGDTA